jgi:hypothetical protein
MSDVHETMIGDLSNNGLYSLIEMQPEFAEQADYFLLNLVRQAYASGKIKNADIVAAWAKETAELE